MKIRILIAVILISLCVSISAREKDFSIELNHSYYNPLADSFAWQIHSKENISDRQCIEISVEIYQRETNKLFNSFSGKYMKGKKDISFYAFLSHDKEKINLKFSAPDMNGGCGFTMFHKFIAQDFFAREKLEINANEKSPILEIIPPLPLKTKIAGYKQTSAEIIPISDNTDKPVKSAPLNYSVFISLKIVDANQENSLSGQPDVMKKYNGLSKDELELKYKELLKTKKDTEKLFFSGKTDIKHLNDVQSELNAIILTLEAKGVSLKSLPQE